MAQLQPLFACRECALVQDVRRSSKTGVWLSRNALRQTIDNEGTHNILCRRAQDSYCTSIWTLSPLKCMHTCHDSRRSSVLTCFEQPEAAAAFSATQQYSAAAVLRRSRMAAERPASE